MGLSLKPLSSNKTKTTTNNGKQNGEKETMDEIEDIPTEMLFGALDKTDANEQQQHHVTSATKYVIKEEIRQRILNQTYKYPYYFKYIAIICIVLWSLLCAIITTLWCLWFDADLFLNNDYQSEIDYYSNNCSTYTSSVAPYTTIINYNLTQSEMNQILSQFDGYFYNPPQNDSFNSNYNVAQRFLLCVLLSYILSVFFWQPLILAIKSLFMLKRYIKNPNRVNEAMLFYSSNVNADSKIAIANTTTNKQSGGDGNSNGDAYDIANDNDANGMMMKNNNDDDNDDDNNDVDNDNAYDNYNDDIDDVGFTMVMNENKIDEMMETALSIGETNVAASKSNHETGKDEHIAKQEQKILLDTIDIILEDAWKNNKANEKNNVSDVVDNANKQYND